MTKPLDLTKFIEEDKPPKKSLDEKYPLWPMLFWAFIFGALDIALLLDSAWWSSVIPTFFFIFFCLAFWMNKVERRYLREQRMHDFIMNDLEDPGPPIDWTEYEHEVYSSLSDKSV